MLLLFLGGWDGVIVRLLVFGYSRPMYWLCGLLCEEGGGYLHMGFGVCRGMRRSPRRKLCVHGPGGLFVREV
jgi:hypothetical protein